MDRELEGLRPLLAGRTASSVTALAEKLDLPHRALALDDPAALGVLNRKAYSGVFQFTGQALKGIADQVTTTSLEDIVAMTALSVKQHRGAANDIIGRARERIDIELRNAEAAKTIRLVVPK